MRFVGEDGNTPSRAARRYVYAVLASALANVLTDRGGWVRGGLEPVDERLAVKEARMVIAYLERKAAQ